MRLATQHSPFFLPTHAPSDLRIASLARLDRLDENRFTSLPPSESTPALKFGICELRIDTRELLVAGTIQHVQPRVFALLLYLVERRDRVVTRDELLQHVWKTTYVSDSVIGRCIMKARRVIHDGDPKAPIIRTLPRIGYRFAGSVSQSLPAPAIRHPDITLRQGQASVATLPFVNLTGKSELVWVEFGLAALLNRTLEANKRYSVSPILDVLGVLEGNFEEASSTAVERVSRFVGADTVIAVQVHPYEDGFELRYRMHRQAAVCAAGRLCGNDLAQMTLDLGRRLIRELAACEGFHLAPAKNADTFASEAYVRAMRAAEEQRFQLALHYLEVCMVSDPIPIQTAAEYVETLAAVSHPETPAKAQLLLGRAGACDDAAIQARVLSALSTYHHEQGNDTLARGLIQDALNLVENRCEDALSAAVLLQRCEVAIVHREFDLVMRLRQRVLALAQANNQRRLEAQTLCQEGVIAHLCGEVGPALESLRRSAMLSRMPSLQCADLARTLHRTAIVHRDAGRMREAITSIDEAVECARLAGTPVRYALTLAFQLMLHSYAGDRAVAATAYGELASTAIQQCRAGRFLADATGAWLSWRTGRIDEALARMTPVRANASEFQNIWLSFAIGLNAGLAIACGRYDLARELIADMETNRRFYEGTCLQGLAEYFRAALAHSQGDRAEAWRLLRQAIAVSCAGVVRSNACLAAAWLGCEDRALDEVEGWLAQVPAWTAEHPNGIVALSRYRFEMGDGSTAAAIQDRYVKNWPSDEITPFQRCLLSTYRDSAKSGNMAAIPRLPHLLTLQF